MRSKKPRIRRRRILGPGINLTPLLDAIFNLVFFFLLATTLRREEVSAQVKLPSSQFGAPSDHDAPSITLQQDGKIFYEGTEVDLEELEIQLRILADGGATEVELFGDKEAMLGPFWQLMDICRSVGININLKAEKKSPATRQVP